MSKARPSLRAFAGYFLKLGTFGFGGPIALAGAMHQDLVASRGWISEEDYQEGLTLAQLAPGPLAAQLAIYLGHVRAGALGATLVAGAFVLPSFLMVLALSVLYAHFGELRWMQAVFYGIGAAVIGIIAHSAFKLANATLKRDLLAWTLFASAALTTALTGREWVLLILAGGAAAWMLKTKPWKRRLPAAGFSLWTLGGLKGVAPASALGALFWFFAKAGLFVFGSGLAIVPFLHGGVVDQMHWLTERQFLDAVAVAMITPGPVVITVAFIGYLVAGPLGACAAALGVFLPTYLMVVLAAPFFRRHGKRPGLKAFVLGVTAGAIGAIAGAAFVLARGAIRDFPTAIIALVSLGLVGKTRLPTPALVLGAGFLGWTLYRG